MNEPRRGRADGAAWTCPACDRRFGRRNQSHECRPGTTLDAWFADRPPEHRRICDLIIDHLWELGPIDVDPVDVGVLIKRSRTFVELRPRRGHLALSFMLSRRVEDPRIFKRLSPSATRHAHFVELAEPSDVDDQLREWLTEAYADSPA